MTRGTQQGQFTQVIQLGLGTVQIGLPYGNRRLEPLMPESEAFAILDTALKAGIRFFDTAVGYGESEARIGAFGLAGRCPEAEIATKIPTAPNEIWKSPALYRNFVLSTLETSRTRLSIPRHGLLQFHQSTLDFLAASALRHIIAELLEKGLCREVGVSVYTPEEADAALGLPGVSAIQAPVNVLDDRFLQPAIQTKLRAKGVRLLARSIFLQGVLVDGAAIPEVTRKTELLELRRLCKVAASHSGETLQSAALRCVFANAKNLVAVGILGVDSAQTLKENLGWFGEDERDKAPLDPHPFGAARAFAMEKGLLNPALWNAP